MTPSGAKKSGHTHGEICFSLGQYRKVINPLCTVKAGNKFIPLTKLWVTWVGSLARFVEEGGLAGKSKEED